MPVTQDDIGNMALAIVNGGTITSLDENTTAARILSLHWDTVVEKELSKRAWSFAIKTAELEGEDTLSGDNTLNWKYDLPSDFIRILPLTYNGQADGVPISYRMEGNFLYTDQSSPRTIRYIENLADPSEWTSAFIDVVVAALAIRLAYGLTGKLSFIEIAQKAYDRAVSEAALINAFESGRLYRESWAMERGDNRFARP